jgi:nitrile hydratase
MAHDHNNDLASYSSAKVAEIHEELHSHLPSESALRVKALETVLQEKGLLNSATVDAFVELYSNEIGPMRGAKVVAHAWCDDAFKQRLLNNGTEAIAEFGFAGHATGHLNVVENTDAVHNVVVCTLCSCYPFSILGVAPAWYKEAAYRSRVVREPRNVLAEFGVVIPESVEVRVWDSTAELRYLVLPQRPAGTENLDEDALSELVSRNSMIGTDRLLSAGL